METTTATLDDISKLSELLDSLLSQESEFTPNVDAQIKGLSEIISNKEIGDILIVRNGNEILGMLNLLYTVSTALGGRVALLEDMVVSPKVRGQNIGSILVDYAIKFAKERDCKRITLLTDADNEGAHRFYKRHGFDKSSMVPFRLNLDIEKNF